MKRPTAHIPAHFGHKNIEITSEKRPVMHHTILDSIYAVTLTVWTLFKITPALRVTQVYGSQPNGRYRAPDTLP